MTATTEETAPETVSALPETAECARCGTVSGRAAMTFNGEDWYCGRLPEATAESDETAVEAAHAMYLAAIEACERRREEHRGEVASAGDESAGAEAA